LPARPPERVSLTFTLSPARSESVVRFDTPPDFIISRAASQLPIAPSATAATSLCFEGTMAPLEALASAFV
jgi:hypothetical protein